MPSHLESPSPELVVGVADMKESKDANGVIITYALGSCLGITCYDPISRIGGLLHAMLADSKGSYRMTPWRGMFLNTAVPDLIQRVVDLGGNPRVFQFKVFGGAQSFQATDYFNIGTKNIKMMEALVAQLHLQVKVWNVGGQQNRTIRFHLQDGHVTLRTPGQPEIFL